MSERSPSKTDAPLDYATWAEKAENGVLLGQRCEDCGFTTATPKRACARCGCRSITTVELPRIGEVHSETTIQVPPTGFESGYQVALIDLGGPRLLARIDGHVEIGDAVEFERVERTTDDPALVFG